MLPKREGISGIVIMKLLPGMKKRVYLKGLIFLNTLNITVIVIPFFSRLWKYGRRSGTHWRKKKLWPIFTMCLSILPKWAEVFPGSIFQIQTMFPAAFLECPFTAVLILMNASDVSGKCFLKHFLGENE